MSNTKKILFFFGTRPEAIKMAPVVEALAKDKRFQVTLAVSAQHRQMLDQVLKLFRLKASIDLDLMRPGQNLFDLTTRVIKAFEPVLQRSRPDLVLVHGDTTTTFAGALAAYYQQVPVGHVEAGLRTNDIYRPFPEEVNRRLTDTISALHFAPTELSRKNLLRENISPKSIFVTGNTVIDALMETVKMRRPPESAGLRKCLPRLQKKIIFMTAHRRENFGAPFVRVLEAVRMLSKKFPNVDWVYPVHLNPNVHKPAHKYLSKLPNVHLIDPVSYADTVWLLKHCTLVVTDSGGLQEEAPAFGKPVLVLRDVTERPEAVKAGTVSLVGADRERIIKTVSRLLTDKKAYRKMSNAVNPYGDGRAAQRIHQAILWYFGIQRAKPAPFKR